MWMEAAGFAIMEKGVEVIFRQTITLKLLHSKKGSIYYETKLGKI